MVIILDDCIVIENKNDMEGQNYFKNLKLYIYVKIKSYYANITI